MDTKKKSPSSDVQPENATNRNKNYCSILEEEEDNIKEKETIKSTKLKTETTMPIKTER